MVAVAVAVVVAAATSLAAAAVGGAAAAAAAAVVAAAALHSFPLAGGVHVPWAPLALPRQLMLAAALA